MAEPTQRDAGASSASSELVYWWSPRGTERVFDLTAWPDEAVAMARALLEEDGLTHSWEGATIVVDAAHRDDVAGLLDEVVAASLPRLDGASDRTAYDLTDWPDYEVEVLIGALEDEGILHEWTEEGELLVYEVDEDRVDELFERLDLRGPDPGVELDGEALSSLLTTLFVAAGSLADDPDDADAVLSAHRSIQEVEMLAVPYGMNPDGWQVLVADAVELRRLIESEAGGNDEVEGLRTTVSRGAAEAAELGRAGRARPSSADDDDDLGADRVDGDVVGADDGVADGVAGDREDDDDGGVELFGDDAIKAIAARVRDHLKRLL